MRRLYAIVTLGFFLSVAQPVPAQTSSGVPSPPATTQAILDARTKAMPGTGIVAASIDHGVLTTYVSGTAGNSRPLDEHTLFEIGSVTKTFTATALAQMVLDGKVMLSDPVGKYLPSSVRVPSKDGKVITLLTLATQHSGLPRLPSNMDGSRDNPYQNYTTAQLFAFLNGYTLPREPGASFEYSNLGFGLLGLALSRAGHTSYENLIRDNVLTPLDMNETAVAVQNAGVARLSVGHNVDGDPVHSWEFTDAFAGAGAIRSDLTDMVKYLRCNLGQGPLAKACLFAQRPRSTFPGHQIGLAWWTNDTSGFINHGGDTAGYHALVMMNRDRSRGVVLLSNGPAVTDIGAHMLDTQYPVVEGATVPVLSEAALGEYAGTYANQSLGNMVVSVRDEKLYARLADQDAAAIYPSRTDHFYARVVPAYFEFVRENGTVVGLILTQDAKHVDFYRIGADGKPMASVLHANYPAVVSLDAKTLASYAGTYAIRKQPIYTVTVKDGQLFFQVAGQPTFEAFASAKDEFYFKVADAQITFHRDDTGDVTGLTLHQDGMELEASRVTPRTI